MKYRKFIGRSNIFVDYIKYLEYLMKPETTAVCITTATQSKPKHEILCSLSIVC